MASKAFLEKAYLAYFGRPVDKTGEAGYANTTEADVMAGFSGSAESKALYGETFGTSQINAIYNMLFNRDAEPAGLISYFNLVNTGKLSPAAAAMAILDGAQNADKIAVANKIAASAAFTTALDTTAEIIGYGTASAAASARAFLKSVGATAATDTAITAAVLSATTNTATTGQSFTLTPGVDTFDGTSGADFIRGVAGNQNGVQDQTTLNSSDVLNGGAGEDTLALLLTGGNYGGGATLRNIETLQIGTNDQVVNGRTFDYNVNAGGYEVTGVNKVVYDQITTGETLNVVNITPSATGNTIPTLHWANESGSAAGTAGATYRQASIAGTADNQNVILENVSAGVLNIARGIETLTVTSSGTVAANTLNTSGGADGTAADLVSETLLGNGVANDSTLTKVVVKGAVTFGKVATVNVNDNALEGGFGLTNRAANGGNDTGNLVSVNSTVTEIDATDAAGGVAMRFTTRANDGNAVNVTFKGSAAADYIEFARGNVTATGGAGDDTFAFVNGALTNFDFGSADSLVGGAGVDTIQLGVNGVGTVVANTTEFNNKSGIDVLDLRGMTNTVTLADTFVAAADAGTFVVRTDKIYQTSATSTANGAPSNATATANIALEDAAISTVVLTELADNRAIEFIGGSGSDRLVVDNASANANTKLAGGTNAGVGSADSLTVVNTAVLDAADVANISGFELLNLVESTVGNNTFNVTLSETFLRANSTTTVPLTIATVANTYGQALAAGDVVNLEISDLLVGGVAKPSVAGLIVNIQQLVAAGVTVNFQQNGTTVTINAAPAALTANVNTTTAPTAALLANVPGATVAAAAAVTGFTVVAGTTTTGTAGNDNFTTTRADLVAATTAVVGAAGTDQITLSDTATGLTNALLAGKVTGVETLKFADVANTVVLGAAGIFQNITGGTAVDTVTLMAASLAAPTAPAVNTVNLGAGNDILNVSGALGLAASSVLDGGLGLDSLNITASTTLSGVSVNSFEVVTIAAGTTLTLNIADLAQYTNTSDRVVTGGTTVAFANAGISSAVAEFATYNLSTTGINTFTNSLATGVTVTAAGSLFVNTITGGAGADTITGGSGNDTITGGAGADTMTGGTGADTFVFTTASTGLPSATNFDTIADYVKTAGANFDTISATNLILGAQTAAAGAGVATISAGGVATFNAADNTLALHIAAVAAAQQAVAGATTVWQEGPNTYMYISDGLLPVAATDVLIQLTGVTAGALTIAGNAVTAMA